MGKEWLQTEEKQRCIWSEANVKKIIKGNCETKGSGDDRSILIVKGGESGLGEDTWPAPPRPSPQDASIHQCVRHSL